MNLLSNQHASILILLSILSLTPVESMAGKFMPGFPIEGADGAAEPQNFRVLSEGDVIPNYAPPMGTILYKTLGATCAPALTTADWVDVFGGDIAFRTGSASSLLEVNFSSQSSIGTGASDNRILFMCQISQDGGSAWTNCSGQNATNGVILSRRVKDVNGSTTTYQTTTNPGTYIGYVNVLPATDTKLRLRIRYQLAEGTQAFVCFPTVIARY